jgi:hypothetical protein
MHQEADRTSIDQGSEGAESGSIQKFGIPLDCNDSSSR